MIRINNIDVWGFEHAIRGMRNPMNSWLKSDSIFFKNLEYTVGPVDVELMHKLFLAGPSHRKYLRMIFVSMDIIAPLYWWKEYDTYKVGTVANSCSTMHKIHAKEFELSDFSFEHLCFNATNNTLQMVLNALNEYRDKYLETNDKDYWWQMIQLLPTSYNQNRTVTFSYENAVNFIEQRSEHKLDEWTSFTSFLKVKLPYLKEIMEGEDNGDETETLRQE